MSLPVFAQQQIEHQPYPIADFMDGLYLPKEPWLSPRNAFRKLEDGRVFRGRLQKRNGMSRFAELTDSTAETSRSSPGFVGDYAIYDFATVPTLVYPIPESCLWTRTDTTNGAITASPDIVGGRWYTSPEVSAQTNNTNVWECPVVATGTSTVLGWMWIDPNHATIPGQANINWELHPDHTDGSSYSVGPFTFWPRTELPVLGLYRFSTGASEFSLASSTTGLYRYDPSALFYKRQGFATAVGPNTFQGPFTGDAEDYWWYWPLDNYLVMTNGVDPVCKWLPTGSPTTSIVEMDTDWTTPGTNELDTALIVLRFRGRLVYLNTKESATDYPRRARYTAAGTFESWDSALDFVDAPADLGSIVTAQFIGERLFVGFDHGWMELVSTGDPVSPFDWRPFIARFGAVSKLSTIKDNERLLSRSDTTMQAIDPNGQYYVDHKIPDFVQGFSADKTHLCASYRNEADRAFWWTYVDASKTTTENVLVATYDEENNLSWSKYGIRLNAFSDFDSSQQPTWNSLGPRTWNDYTGVSWNSARVGAVGFTQTIAGGDRGTVYLLDASAQDQYIDGWETVEFFAETQRLSPFPNQVAHLGWIDLYADAASQGTLTLTFYADDQSAAYQSTSVTLTPTGNGSKIYRRVPVGRSSVFHRIRLDSADGKRLAIDALIPWFRPAGRVRGFN